MQNKNWIIITGSNLRFSGCCETKSFSDWLRNCWIRLLTYVLFGVILTKFYVNFSRGNIRCLIGIVLNLKFSGFILYPFHFSITVPLKYFHRISQNLKIILIFIFSHWYFMWPNQNCCSLFLNRNSRHSS